SVVRSLVAAGANVNIPGRLGRTPLHYAVKNNNIKIARVLLMFGANTMLISDAKQTARDIAVQNGYNDMIKLIDQYSDTDVTTVQPICLVTQPVMKYENTTDNSSTNTTDNSSTSMPMLVASLALVICVLIIVVI
ncbi:unnamed protein product, partial [Meganyctiphanes norvegica]